MVKRVKNPLKNVCEKLTHMHMRCTLGGVSTFAKVVKFGVESSSKRASDAGLGERRTIAFSPTVNPSLCAVECERRTLSAVTASDHPCASDGAWPVSVGR